MQPIHTIRALISKIQETKQNDSFCEAGIPRFHRIVSLCLGLAMSIVCCAYFSQLQIGATIPGKVVHQAFAADSDVLACTNQSDNHVHTSECGISNAGVTKGENRSEPQSLELSKIVATPLISSAQVIQVESLGLVSDEPDSLAKNSENGFGLLAGDTKDAALLGAAANTKAVPVDLGIVSHITIPEHQYGWGGYYWDLKYDYPDEETYVGTILIEPDDALGVKVGDTFGDSNGGTVVVGQETEFTKNYKWDYWIYGLPEGIKYTVKQTSATPFRGRATMSLEVDGNVVDTSLTGEYSGTIKATPSKSNYLTIDNIPLVEFSLYNTFEIQDEVIFKGDSTIEYELKFALREYDRGNPVTFTIYDAEGVAKSTHDLTYDENESYAVLRCSLEAGESVSSDELVFGTNYIVDIVSPNQVGVVSVAKLTETDYDGYQSQYDYPLGAENSITALRSGLDVRNIRADATYTLSKQLGQGVPIFGPVLGPEVVDPGGLLRSTGSVAPLSGAPSGVSVQRNGATPIIVDAPSGEGGGSTTLQTTSVVDSFQFVVKIAPDNVYLKPGDKVFGQKKKIMSDVANGGLPLEEVLEEIELVVGEENTVELSVYDQSSGVFEQIELIGLPVGTLVECSEILNPNYTTSAMGADVAETQGDRFYTSLVLKSPEGPVQGSDPGSEIVVIPISNVNNIVTFFNNRVPGDLSVTKQVVAETINPNERFNIRIGIEEPGILIVPPSIIDPPVLKSRPVSENAVTQLQNLTPQDPTPQDPTPQDPTPQDPFAVPMCRIVDKDGNPIDGTAPENAGILTYTNEYMVEAEIIEISEIGEFYYRGPGEYQVQLRHGDKIVFSQLSGFATFLVEEDAVEGYETTIYDESLEAEPAPNNSFNGIIDSPVKNIIVRNAEPETQVEWGVLLPEMGSKGLGSLPLAGGILFGCGAVATLLFRTRNILRVYGSR